MNNQKKRIELKCNLLIAAFGNLPRHHEINQCVQKCHPYLRLRSEWTSETRCLKKLRRHSYILRINSCFCWRLNCSFLGSGFLFWPTRSRISAADNFIQSGCCECGWCEAKKWEMLIVSSMDQNQGRMQSINRNFAFLTTLNKFPKSLRKSPCIDFRGSRTVKDPI